MNRSKGKRRKHCQRDNNRDEDIVCCSNLSIDGGGHDAIDSVAGRVAVSCSWRRSARPVGAVRNIVIVLVAVVAEMIQIHLVKYDAEHLSARIFDSR